MTVFKDKKVRKSLEKKGFKQEPSSHHNYYYLYDQDGKRTKINTHTSRNEQEIGNFLIGQMSKQLKLSKEDFIDLINCPLSYEEYIAKLKEKNEIR